MTFIETANLEAETIHIANINERPVYDISFTFISSILFVLIVSRLTCCQNHHRPPA